jgi:hypothetical protein
MRSTILRAVALVIATVNASACQTKDARATVARASVAQQQPAPGTVEQYTAAMLSQLNDALARSGQSTRTFGRHTGYWYVEARRVANGTPEVHDDWIDVTLVQAGHANLLTGGKVVGSRIESPGEHRGGTIVGGTARAIAPGDLLVIPAGTPHQYLVGRADSVRYLTIKVTAGAQK